MVKRHNCEKFAAYEGYLRCSFFLPRRESGSKRIINLFYLTQWY